MAKKCKKGQIRRKAYKRKAYTREDGTRVKATKVASDCIKDRGKPGRGKDIVPDIKEGSLGGPGYTTKSTTARRRILSSCVRKEDYASCLGKLQYLLLVGAREWSKTKLGKVEADKKWLMKKYGGPGSVGPRRNPKKKRRGKRRNAPKGWTPIGVIGDMNPIEHWGGIIYETQYGVEMIYFQESEGTVWAYRVDIDDDPWSDLDWVDWDGVEDSTGTPVEEIEQAAKSDNVLARAGVYEAAGSYHGWGEFDQQPETLTLEKAEAKYGDDVDRAHAAKRNPIKDMPGGSVSGCIKVQQKKPKGKRPTDAGAYCASIADKIEPGWREKNPRMSQLANRLSNP